MAQAVRPVSSISRLPLYEEKEGEEVDIPLASVSKVIVQEMEKLLGQIQEEEEKHPSLREAMRELMISIEKCKVEFLHSSSKRTDFHVDIDKHAIDLLDQTYKELLKELKKMHKKQKQAKKWGIVTKVFQAVMAIASIAITVCTAGLATGAILGAVTALQLSGGLQAISKEIQKGLKSAGLDEDVAAFLANTIVIISVALVTAGVGAGVSASGAAAIPVGGLTTVVALQTATGLGFLPSLIQAIPGDKDAKKWTSLIFGIIESLITSIVTYKITTGFSGESVITGKWREILTTLGIAGNFVGGIGTAVGQFGEGSTYLELAKIAKRRGTKEAAVTLISGVIDVNANGMQSENRHRQNMMGMFSNMTESYSEFARVYQSLARTLSR